MSAHLASNSGSVERKLLINFDVIRPFELASGRKIPYSLSPRRSGDVAVCYANPVFA